MALPFKYTGFDCRFVKGQLVCRLWFPGGHTRDIASRIILEHLEEIRRKAREAVPSCLTARD